jgi:hypothetical protein
MFLQPLPLSPIGDQPARYCFWARTWQKQGGIQFITEPFADFLWPSLSGKMPDAGFIEGQRSSKLDRDFLGRSLVSAEAQDSQR